MNKSDKIQADNAIVDLSNALKRWNITEDEHNDPEWRKRVEDSLTNLSRALGCVPREDDPFGPLDFVAKIVYSYDCASKNQAPVRWWALRDDLKKEFREKAVNTIASWAQEELEQERMMGKPRLVK